MHLGFFDAAAYLSVANMAWALAVFDVTDPHVLEWFWDLIERTHRQMDAIHLRQLHQLLLTCAQAGQSPTPDLFPRAAALMDTCLQVYARTSRDNVTASQLQRHVAQALVRAGHAVEVRSPH